MLRFLRMVKISWTEHKEWSLNLLIFVSLLAFLIFYTPFPRRFIDHLAQMYQHQQGKANIDAVHWVEFNPRVSDFFQQSTKRSTTGEAIAVSRWPLAAAEINPTTTKKWSWPSFPKLNLPFAQTSVQDSPPSKGKWSWPSFSRSNTGAEIDPYADRQRFPVPQRVTLSHIESDHFTNCFATNYTKAQLLFAGEYIPGKFLPQFDFRGDRFDDTTYAASGGLVLRYIPKEGGPVNRILGINAYYDYRQGNIGYFKQIGGGIEILGKRLDFRANVYVPVGGKRKMRRCVFDDFEGGFFATKDSFESISFAYNAEIGWLAIDSSRYLFLYLAGGPYYIAGRKCFDKTLGGEFRIQPQYKDYIALNAIVSHDPLFHTVYQFEVILHLPLYLLSKKIHKKATSGLTARQIYQPVIRYDVMPIGRCTCWMFNWDDLAH